MEKGRENSKENEADLLTDKSKGKEKVKDVWKQLEALLSVVPSTTSYNLCTSYRATALSLLYIYISLTGWHICQAVVQEIGCSVTSFAEMLFMN